MTEHNGYSIESLGTFSLVKIKNKGQGPVPKALSGYFTTVNEAKRFIDGYVDSKKKGSANGTSKDISTG